MGVAAGVVAQRTIGECRGAMGSAAGVGAHRSAPRPLRCLCHRTRRLTFSPGGRSFRQLLEGGGKRRRARDGTAESAASRRPERAHERPPNGQNARLRAGVKMNRPHRERDRIAPVSRATASRQFPLRPYRKGQLLEPKSRSDRMPVYGAGWRRKRRARRWFSTRQSPRQFPLHPTSLHAIASHSHQISIE